MIEQQNDTSGGDTAIGPAGLPGTSGLARAFDDISTDGDMLSARAVQSRLLPHKSLRFPNLLCETYYRPFHNIGGDYYDFVPLERNRLGIAIGDVAGKGVGAALIMASLQASLRARLLHPGTRPGALLRSLNESLYLSSQEHVYATLFYGEYDLESRVFTYVNAGHNSPLIGRPDADRNRILRLESEGPPIGVFPDAIYEERSCVLRPRDVFVAYTDGVTEANGRAYEYWGPARLETVLHGCAGMQPADIVLAILSARERFTCSAGAEDDTTLLVASVED